MTHSPPPLVPRADLFTLEPPPADARLRYGADDPVHQFGDLRLPAGDGPFPVVVGIHGGFWRAAWDLTYFGHVCAALTRSLGCATWNLEYRRVGQSGGGWPGTFTDVALGLDHLRTLAQKYPLDITRVVIIGYSAGGHLALWLAGRHTLPLGSELRTTEHPLPVRGVVALAGVVDLRRAWDLRLDDGITEAFMGGPPDTVPDRYTAGSPIELLPFGRAVRQILVHGTADTRVPYELSRRYQARASTVDDLVDLVTLPDVGHFELVDPRPHSPGWPAVLDATRRTLES